MVKKKKKRSSSISQEDGIKRIIEDFISDYIAEHFGEEYKDISRVNDLTDTEIAELLNLKVTKVRSVLNKLFESRFLNYKKLNGKGNRFIFKWYVDYERARRTIIEFLIEELEEINALLEQLEKGEVYICNYCYRVYEFDACIELDFKCECGNELVSESLPASLLERKHYLEEVLSKLNI